MTSTDVRPDAGAALIVASAIGFGLWRARTQAGHPDHHHHHHRRHGWLWLVAAVLVVVGVPMVLLAVPRGDGEQSSTGPPAPATPGSATPDGRILFAALRNAALDIPAWPGDGLVGQAGRVAFTDHQAPPGTAGQPYLVLVEPAVYGDVDGDDAQETLVIVRCMVTKAPERRSEQLLALDRDLAGRITTLGTVVATTGGVRIIGLRQSGGGDFRASPYDPAAIVIRPDTAIEVRVGDYVAPATGDPAIAQWQTRTYSWTGQGFRQTAGPTSFPTNRRLTDVSVTASDLVLYSPQGRAPRGALRVTVALNRPVAPRQMSLVVFLPANLVVDESSTPGYGASEPVDGWYTVSATFAPPAPGISRTFLISLVQSAPGGGTTISSRVGFSDDRLGDADPLNDEVVSTVRLVTA